MPNQAKDQAQDAHLGPRGRFGPGLQRESKLVCGRYQSISINQDPTPLQSQELLKIKTRARGRILCSVPINSSSLQVLIPEHCHPEAADRSCIIDLPAEPGFGHAVAAIGILISILACIHTDSSH